MVADHQNKVIYIAQEDSGIWKVSAEPNQMTKKLIFKLDTVNKNVVADLEGLAIYKTIKKQGFLIVSSQGNNSFAMIGLNGKYLGSFRIGDGSTDAVEETDGIEIASFNLGQKYPKGVFIAQDGKNFDADSLLPQNFKIVDWTKIMDLH